MDNVLELIGHLTHSQIMYYSILIVWFSIIFILKGKATYEMIVGDDGKAQMPEVFQFVSMNAVVIYLLEVAYYHLPFHLGVVFGLLILAITGDIRETLKTYNDIKKQAIEDKKSNI